MSIRTSKLRVAPLRGMDQRWQVNPTSASKIVDMTWSDQDSWVRAGGYNYIVRDYVPDDWIGLDDNTSFTPQETVTKSTSGSAGDGPILTQTDISYLTSSPASNPYTQSASRAPINAYSQETDAPISLHWFAQHNGGLQWLVYETSAGKLRYFNGSRAPVAPWTDVYYIDGNAMDGTNYKRKVVTAPWEGTQFATFAARLYMVNGFNKPMVFDGRKASPLGFFGPPDAPGVERYDDEFNEIHVSFALGLGTPGDSGSAAVRSSYSYKVSFVNERGQESPLSASENIVFLLDGSSGSNTGKVKTLLNLELPIGPDGTVARRIYRTQNIRNASGDQRTKEFGSEFFFLTEIQDNITRVFTDVKPDKFLATLVDELDFGSTPSQATMIAMFKGRSFLVGNNDNIVRYSRPNFPEVFPVDNQLDLSDTSGSRITALYASKNSLIAFKDRGIYLIKGDTTDGFFAQTLTKDVGCIAPNSIKEVPGLGLFFLASDGIYVLEGALENTGTRTAIVKISQPIRDLIRDINFGAVENCRSLIYHRDREYWLSVPTIGTPDCSRVLKFSYEIGAWSYMDDMPIKDMTETEDHRGYLFFVSNDTSTKGIYHYSRGYTTKGGVALSTEYETSDIPFGSVYENFVPVRVQGRIIGYGNNDLEMNFTTNRELTQAYEVNKSTQQKRPLEDLNISVYGTTAWGDGSVYAQHRPVYARFDINTMHKGPVNEVKVSFTPTSGRIELLEFQLEARIGSRRDVINLTSKMGGTETR